MASNQKYTGLTDEQVVASREQYGPNILTPARKEPWWKLFLDKFRDPLIIILLVAGVLSIGISLYEYYSLGQGTAVFIEPLGIFVAILLATGLAFIFEMKAEKEFAILNQVNDDEPVQVIRNGNATTVPKRDIVVGDIVLLSTGEEIPADGQLLEAALLNVDESTLTGEPMAHKTVDPQHFDKDATFPSDAVMRGTKVMEGHGVMKVTAVGDATENGKVMQAATIDDKVRTPLDDQLDRLGSLVAKFSYIVGILIVVGRVALYFANFDFEWMTLITFALQTLMIAVTLIVVSVPEGLPMAVTLSLAYSMRRMLKTNNLVRKLHACETMGATTVICTDKTGTLTQNMMQVAYCDFFGNPSADIIADGIALNSTAQLDFADPTKPKPLGNPTEGALLLWLFKGRKTDYRALREEVTIESEVPFSTERKYMATLIQNRKGERIIYVKGAPEIVFGLCSDSSEVSKSEIDALLLQYQNQAMRTLGFAYAVLTPEENGIKDEMLTADNLKFVGIAAISDPVRADVPDAVREVENAGIEVKIVTGDTPGTARQIGREIGLWTAEDDRIEDANPEETIIMTGEEFARIPDEKLPSIVRSLKIIARARPLDKKRLVEALQKNGEVVAVTGDGTNDAPALKAAQVGLSMGDGTSVAKEASDITIIDNSFASIGRAVLWGRSLYRNIQRFILFQLTVNVAASLIVLLGGFMDVQSPLTVTQMLWVNLIMDTFAAVALASLPPTHNVMNEKPRKRTDFIINKGMWWDILGVGGLFFLLLTGFLYYLQHVDITALTQIPDIRLGSAVGMTPYNLSVFFSVFVFLQFWNLFNARAFRTGRSAFHFKNCKGFLLIATLIFVGQIVIVQLCSPVFNVVPLSVTDWLIIILGTSPVLIIGELVRLFRK